MCSVLASIGIWALIFAGGWALYGRFLPLLGALLVAGICAAGLPRWIGRLRIRD
jgi:hypothetical protein